LDLFDKWRIGEELDDEEQANLEAFKDRRHVMLQTRIQQTRIPVLSQQSLAKAGGAGNESKN
jgi:hypothetical protein